MEKRIYSQEEINKLFPQKQPKINRHHKVVWLREKGNWIEWWDYCRAKGKLLIHQFEEIKEPVTDALEAQTIRYHLIQDKATHYYYLMYEVNGYYAGLKVVMRKDDNQYKVVKVHMTSISTTYDNSWWI